MLKPVLTTEGNESQVLLNNSHDVAEVWSATGLWGKKNKNILRSVLSVWLIKVKFKEIRVWSSIML